VLTAEEEKALARATGTQTLTRGRAYARRGAVRAGTWSDDGSSLIGRVQGGAREPYSVIVSVRRSPPGRIVEFDSDCTCPVAVCCKHAVALVLATAYGEDPAGAHVRTLRPVPTPRVPAWEEPLRALLATGTGEVPSADPGELGLQFEVAGTSGRSSTAGAPDLGIRLRPVVRSRSGNWVRTGTSWSRLEYQTYGWQAHPTSVARVSILLELRALSRLAAPRQYYYSSTDEPVWLQTVTSRRVWDLLLEASAAGLPLVESGRAATPVDLRTGPAQVVLDTTRHDGGLTVRPQVTIGAGELPLTSAILIGDPAHGLAWREEPGVRPPGEARLGLAPFDRVLDDTVVELLRSEPLAVPAGDEDRFLHDYTPRLRQRIEIRSSDRSVELPEAPEARIVLTMRHLPGHRLGLEWSRGAEGRGWRDPLWGVSEGRGDRMGEDAIVRELEAVVGPVPHLLEETLFGRRLAATVLLEGMPAVTFLTRVLPEVADVEGVEVEHDGEPVDYREVLEAPLVQLGGTRTDDRDWFDLSVTVTVDGEDVPFADLFVALAEGRSHLILPSGAYFSLDREELRQLAALIAEARALGDDPEGAIRLSRFQAGLWDDLRSIGEVSAQARDWEESVRSLADAGHRIEHAVPGGLEATLRPYQLTGFNWLAYLYEHGLGGVLADDMGLGKTVQALALMCHTIERGLSRDPYLVVAPTSVVGNWASECAKFAPDLRVVAVTETAARRGVGLDELAGAVDVVVTSYALFRLEFDGYAALGWAGLFLDEAQFAKNRASQAYRCAKLLPAPTKVAMTGTPIENSLMELWSLLSITAPGLFPSADRFTEHYRTPIEKKGDTARLGQLRRRIRPLLLRRTKEEVLRDLPDKQEQVMELELSPRHRKLYQTYLQRERQKILGLLGDLQQNRMAIFRSLTLLRQASLDMSLVDGRYTKVPSAKLDALMEMIEDIAADGHRVLVFSQFTRFLELARRRVERAGIDHCYLDGSTTKRSAVISRFRDGTAPVFLISLKAGGFGLNLTEADYCILLDPWWNPATEAQAVDRIHRIGQTRKVMVYRLVAKDTLEEKVMALKARKSELIASVMDTGDFGSGAMSAADIAELLS